MINNIFPNFDVNNISQMQFEQLQKIASNSGKADVLEYADISSGENKLKSDIIKGEASFQNGVINFLLGGNLKGDIFVSVPKGTTMADIKEMYNLPDGALSNYCKQAGCPGGNKDSFETIADQVWFSAEAFAKGNNMTLEDVKKLFK